MRDYVQAHPDEVQAYGALKDQRAVVHSHDVLAYTQAKTAIIHRGMDHARAERGPPSIDVWEA